MFFTHFDSPIGPLLLAGDGVGLCRLSIRDTTPEWDWVAEPHRFIEVCQQLAAYFAGQLRDFSLPLVPRGTPFQQRVWAELGKIPYGETISYGELARRIGQPTAARAVGMANHHNPLPIVIPCHRVIGTSGKLVGYGGGLDVQQALLEREGVRVRSADPGRR